MNVSVIVPWRSKGCPHREAAWALARDLWSGWKVHTCDDGNEPFSRAASINRGVDEHPADVYVVADADILIGTDQVRTAVELAADTPGMVLAYERWAHLSQQGTEYVLDGYLGSWEPFIDLAMHGTVSACFAVSHETWRETGGFDSRFRGWGMEDAAFEVACRTLANPTRRVPGTAWHVWHPSEANRPAENVELLHQYEAVDGNPAQLRALTVRA